MLSYKHGFHAGNHADVLKHSVLILVLNKLKTKDKPLTYIDTHAGAGLYDLDGEEALKNSEFLTGIKKLTAAHKVFPLLTDYFRIMEKGDADGERYPGSPGIALNLLRNQDRMILMELHAQEVRQLKKNMRNDRRVAVHHRDGFTGLPALLPPQPPRGLVLIDPSYEIKDDYNKALDCLTASYKRWPGGVYMLWYPVLSEKRDQSGILLNRLAQCGFRNLLRVELRVREQAEDFGMCGSGLALINPPWQLEQQLAELLPVLRGALAENPSGGWVVEWLIAE